MIIRSMLDNDFYKFTMQQAVFELFPNEEVEYMFQCRDDSIDWSVIPLDELGMEISKLALINTTDSDVAFLRSTGYFSERYLKWLRSFKFNFKSTHISLDIKDKKLSLGFCGTWLETILLEVPILAIINELYYKYAGTATSTIQKRIVKHKMNNLEKYPIPFADFGTRRRYSSFYHYLLLDKLRNHPDFVGTSNVYMAKEFGLKPIGTMAHEWIMAAGGMDSTSLRKSQQYMLQKWCDVYRGELGIALSDTYGTEAFLKDFDLYFAKLYDGVRHDSGDPYVWAERMIKHYKDLGIDPKTKTLVFSDSLKVGKSAWRLYVTFRDRINVSMGIGTNLTNDFPNLPIHKALPNVIKMTKFNDNPVGKLSNEPDKSLLTDPNYKEQLVRTFQ